MRYLIYFLFSLFIVTFTGCNKNDEPHPENIETSILLYAVASNNLSYSFYQDLYELKDGLENCDLSQTEVFVYSITQAKDDVPSLYKIVRDKDGILTQEVIKTYDREVASTSPQRISTVIDDYNNLTNASKRGLILWSHATAWAPAPKPRKSGKLANENSLVHYGLPAHNSEYVSVDEVPGVNNFGSITPSGSYWWGQDNNSGVSSYCNITDLASAIPDNLFDYIWFDCCYMSSVEVIYELRNKADRFVAYPTEVLAEGAPYSIIIPYIATTQPDLIGAAEAMSQYYLKAHKTFTIAVIDPNLIDKVADMASNVATLSPISEHDLLLYSRGGYYFYDFGQFISTKQSVAEYIDIEEFRNTMNRLILYKNCGSKLFTGEPIDLKNFSGISSGYIGNLSDLQNTSDGALKYYQSLEWFKRVYMPYLPSNN